MEKLTLFDDRLVSRLSDPDVRNYVQAVFVPLIRQRTTTREERRPEGASRAVRGAWRPFQVTHSQEHPAIPGRAHAVQSRAVQPRAWRSACRKFLDRALRRDVAFAKNAGPQALRIDYAATNGQLALYTPDFLVRLNDGSHILVETKGRVDRDVPHKARAAAAWCKAAGKANWRYLYVPQETFESFTGDSVALLLRICDLALRDLLDEAVEAQLTLPFGEAKPGDERLVEFISDADFSILPSAHQKMVRQAVSLFRFLENKSGQSLAPVFTPLLGPLDEAAKALLLRRLGPDIPAERDAQAAFFAADAGGLSAKEAEMCQRRGSDLKRTLVDHNGTSPIGLLRWCLDFAGKATPAVSEALRCVRLRFAALEPETGKMVNRINQFRNDYVAHQGKELGDVARARDELREWIAGALKLWGLYRTE